MMSSIFYGEIKEDRLNTWKENKNPYDILADNNRIERLGGWDFLFIEITCKASVGFDSSGGFIIIAFAFNSEFVPTPILSIDPPDLP